MADWRKTGELSPGEKQVEEDAKKAVEDLKEQQIAEFKKNAAVKPTKPSSIRHEES
jgi:hypothetical protein